MITGPHSRILLIRLGAMGDILHALPAAVDIKRSFPHCHLTWLVEEKWLPLLAGNPYVDRIAVLRRGSAGRVWRSLRSLRQNHFDIAIDLQGLVKSAMAGWLAGPQHLLGYDASQIREPLCAVLYTHQVAVPPLHMVERHRALAATAGAVTSGPAEFPLPCGKPEGVLPEEPFVLASPLAGWASKQWPLASYQRVAELLQESQIPLVLNVPPNAAEVQRQVPSAWLHTSSLPGLIDATRRAAVVLGVDSGPLHLAAALGKPGVALFGPTDPDRNGPYGTSLRVLRSPDAVTSYKRAAVIDPSMKALLPEQVFAELLEAMATLPSAQLGSLPA